MPRPDTALHSHGQRWLPDSSAIIVPPVEQSSCVLSANRAFVYRQNSVFRLQNRFLMAQCAGG